MREILFRGKRADNGEWIEGDLMTAHRKTFCGNYHEIMSPVVLETVGQYTGLTDMNGKKIFEGDIVRCFGEAGDEHVTVLEWRQERAMFVLKTIEEEPCELYIDPSDFFMLLGNIHDNPELLKGGEE